MIRFHVKKGDEVVVISGTSKGRRARVRLVIPKKQRVVLEALDDAKKDKEAEGVEKSAAGKQAEERQKMINPRMHYMKKSQQHPEGEMLWLEAPIHISNVMKAEAYDARAAKRTPPAGAAAQS